MEQIIHLPLSNMFKNISNDDSYNYINLNKNSIQIKINLANEVLICDKLFYRNYNFSDKQIIEYPSYLITKKQNKYEAKNIKINKKTFNTNENKKEVTKRVYAFRGLKLKTFAAKEN